MLTFFSFFFVCVFRFGRNSLSKPQGYGDVKNCVEKWQLIKLCLQTAFALRNSERESSKLDAVLMNDKLICGWFKRVLLKKSLTLIPQDFLRLEKR